MDDLNEYNCPSCGANSNHKSIIIAFEVKIAELEKLLGLVKKDLLMRAEEDSAGCKVVNLSSFIWIKLKEVLKEGE
jgi:hypothetical protein